MAVVITYLADDNARNRRRARRQAQREQAMQETATGAKNCAKALWLRQSRQSSITRKPSLQEGR